MATLVANPKPASGQQAHQAGPFAQQTAHSDNQDRPEQDMNTEGLPAGADAAEQFGDKQGACHIGGRDPEYRRLQMPCSQQVAGKYDCQVDAVERSWVRSIVRNAGSYQSLCQKQEHCDRHEFERRGLRRAQGPALP